MEPTRYEGGEAVPNRSGIPGIGLGELRMGIQCYIHCLMVLLFSSKVEGEPRFFTELEKIEEEKKVRL